MRLLSRSKVVELDKTKLCNIGESSEKAKKAKSLV